MGSNLAIFGGTPVRNKAFLPQNTIGEEEKKAVIEVIDSGKLSGFIGEYCPEFHGGKKVQETEEKYAEYFRAKYAITVNSASSALQIAVAALGIGPGDEVIVTPYTMSATATAILMQNACPVFVDIDNKTFCMDPDKIEEKISERTKAIMYVDLLGQPAHWDELRRIANKYRLKIIEDGAQAANANYKGKSACTLGDLGILSLNVHKMIHCGEGGVIFTDDDDLAIRCKLIRNHGETSVEHFNLTDISHTMGLNYRMTEIEAAIANVQLDKLPRLFDVRNQLANYLSQKLKSIPGIITPFVQPGVTSAWYLYAIRYLMEVYDVRRETFCKALTAEGIPVEEGYVKPLYLQPMYQQRKGRYRNAPESICGLCGGPKHKKCHHEKGICPTSEKMHFQELLIGNFCHDPLTPNDMDDIADAFYKIIENIDELRVYEKSGGK